jgi:nitrite transporter NirC
MYFDTVEKFADLAVKKRDALKAHPMGFLVASMMAGAYVGLGIILIFCLGNEIDPAYRKLVMGASFGIALTLVVFAGSELFTGLTMTMTHGYLQKRTSLGDLARVWTMSWVGNFLGAALLAALFSAAGGGALLFGKSTFLFDVASAKMAAPAGALFARAVLCNWLVCLALWMASRMTSDSAKCIAIFWCLFAFIASGYEHSIANMTLLVLSLLGNHPDSVSIAGMLYNLFWVTLGNIVSGSLLMGVGYWYVSRPTAARRECVDIAETVCP